MKSFRFSVLCWLAFSTTILSGADAQSPRKEAAAHRTQAGDRKTFALFAKQLNIFNHASTNLATRTSAAMNLIRIYDEFAGENLRSSALMQLNKQGLTLDKLKQIAREGKEYHRVTQFLNYMIKHPEQHERTSRRLSFFYRQRLTPEQQHEVQQMLKTRGLSLKDFIS